MHEQALDQRLVTAVDAIEGADGEHTIAHRRAVESADELHGGAQNRGL
jgi:hypothetical protein